MGGPKKPCRLLRPMIRRHSSRPGLGQVARDPEHAEMGSRVVGGREAGRLGPRRIVVVRHEHRRGRQTPADEVVTLAAGRDPHAVAVGARVHHQPPGGAFQAEGDGDLGVAHPDRVVGMLLPADAVRREAHAVAEQPTVLLRGIAPPAPPHRLVAAFRIRVGLIDDRRRVVHHAGRRQHDVVVGAPFERDDAERRLVPVDAVRGSGVAHVGAVVRAVAGAALIPGEEAAGRFVVDDHRRVDEGGVLLPRPVGADDRIPIALPRLMEAPGQTGRLRDEAVVDEQVLCHGELLPRNIPIIRCRRCHRRSLDQDRRATYGALHATRARWAGSARPGGTRRARPQCADAQRRPRAALHPLFRLPAAARSSGTESSHLLGPLRRRGPRRRRAGVGPRHDRMRSGKRDRCPPQGTGLLVSGGAGAVLDTRARLPAPCHEATASAGGRILGPTRLLDGVRDLLPAEHGRRGACRPAPADRRAHPRTASIAVWRDGYCYYPVAARDRPTDADELFYRRDGWDGDAEPIGTGAMCAAAPILRPIVQYLTTGARNDEAAALCDGIARYVVERAGDFGRDGELPRALPQSGGNRRRRAAMGPVLGTARPGAVGTPRLPVRLHHRHPVPVGSRSSSASTRAKRAGSPT